MELREQGLERVLRLPAGIDFASNDYLGLGRHPEILGALEARVAAARESGEAWAAPASRLLRGTTEAHLALEKRLALFKGQEAALLFSSGYQANVGLLTALLGPNDRAISDAQNHASLIDGLRLSGCQKVVVPHLDLAAFARALEVSHTAGRTVVLVESLYSMDGDIAPLRELADLCATLGADLIVDDAHATGVFGDDRGSGLVEALGVERRVAAVVTTFGKALASGGACVSGSRALIDYLVTRSRAFLFSTAQPPFALWAVEAALDRLAAEPELRVRVRQLADRLRAGLRSLGVDTLRSAGPIVPLVLGENRRVLQVAEALQDRGFDVRAVRPPTVAPGTARLRISIHAERTDREVDALVAAIGQVLAAPPVDSPMPAEASGT